MDWRLADLLVLISQVKSGGQLSVGKSICAVHDG